jgi:hypothetical protein
VDPLGGAMREVISALGKRQKIGHVRAESTPHPSKKNGFPAATDHVICIYSLKSLDN